MKLFSIAAALLVLSLVLGLGSTLAVAAERPSNPAQLLLWFLSLNKSRDTAERPKTDINSATAEALAAVPGLDRRQALRIIANRPYATLQDLVRAGLSARFIERLTGLLTAESRLVEQGFDSGSRATPSTRVAAPAR
jgi:DNA uptake protein ComE-like DNA-binding protein